MKATPLDLLIITDIHYIRHAKHTCSIAHRACSLGDQLIDAVLHTATENLPDAVVLTGDIVDNGEAQEATRDLIELSHRLNRIGVPIIAVLGNHDGPYDAYYEVFSPYRPLHVIKGYTLYCAVDRYDHTTSTSTRDMGLMEKTFAQRDSNLPVIALQHANVYPTIQSSYPYNLTNAEQIHQFYTKHGVCASVSGHYHDGLEPVTKDDVLYYTCAALCEYPYRYARLRCSIQKPKVTEHRIA